MEDRSSLKAVGWARTLPLHSGAKAARDWTRAHLETLGWTRTAPELVDSIVLIVSELVTNAHVHARSTAQLILTCDEGCLHVTVHDADPGLPRPRRPGTDSPGGRGLLLVDALAHDWEIHRCPRGKDVIACFRPPAHPSAA
ncbi:ATP-binding protein [Streptomyces malaysiense]|uniref:ATP-binding protein n=1 Tax=Streptomyces malaysiense TaxID=1428626 RepID=A0A1J4Q7L5_9ACTN|nr:ATP-binding protein [Streptomyces malaysiense]OIK29189.1 ATP-binding protein [Streptomyces malaysiense]